MSKQKAGDQGMEVVTLDDIWTKSLEMPKGEKIKAYLPEKVPRGTFDQQMRVVDDVDAQLFPIGFGACIGPLNQGDAVSTGL